MFIKIKKLLLSILVLFSAYFGVSSSFVFAYSGTGQESHLPVGPDSSTGDIVRENQPSQPTLYAVESPLYGPETGSGGGYILGPSVGTFLGVSLSKPRLVDLFNLTDEKRKTLEKEYFNLEKSIESSGLKISYFEKPTVLKINENQNPEDIAFLHMQLRINSWNQINISKISLLAHWIRLTSYNILWDFTDDPISPASHYLPEYAPNTVVSTVANYQTDRFGGKNRVKISRKIWNQFSLVDKVGLLFHETLRSVQIAQEFDFNDHILQKATGILLYCKPTRPIEEKLMDYFFIKSTRLNSHETAKDLNEILTTCEKF